MMTMRNYYGVHGISVVLQIFVNQLREIDVHIEYFPFNSENFGVWRSQTLFEALKFLQEVESHVKY